MTQVLTLLPALQGLSRLRRGCSCARQRCGAPIRARRWASVCSAWSPPRPSRFGACHSGRPRRGAAPPPAPPPMLVRASSLPSRRSGQRRNPCRDAVPIPPRRRSSSRATRRRARRRSIALPARSITRPATRTQTASAPSRRWSSTASATPPSRRSVCGVVYQGSTRPTGCQFTFTCDGSLYRQPDADGWRRAYGVAAGRACRARLCAGRLGHPLSRRLCRPLLGLDAGQECGRRRAHLLSLGGRLGTARGLHQGLCRA